jgi:hypothetical protein
MSAAAAVHHHRANKGQKKLSLKQREALEAEWENLNERDIECVNKFYGRVRAINAKREVESLKKRMQLSKMAADGVCSLAGYLLFVFLFFLVLALQKDTTNAFLVERTIRGTIESNEGWEEITDLHSAWHFMKDIYSQTYSPGDYVTVGSIPGHETTTHVGLEHDPFAGLPNRCACCNTGYKVPGTNDTCKSYIAKHSTFEHGTSGGAGHGADAGHSADAGADADAGHGADAGHSNRNLAASGGSAHGATFDPTAMIKEDAHALEQCAHNHTTTCCAAYDWCEECEQCGGTIAESTHTHHYELLPDKCKEIPLRTTQESLFSLHSTIYGNYDETAGYNWEHLRYWGPFILKQHRYASKECHTKHDFYSKCLDHDTEMVQDITLESSDFHSSFAHEHLNEGLKNKRLATSYHFDPLVKAFVYEGDLGIFAYPKEVVECQLEALHESLWLSRATKDLELDVFMYNGNLDVYSILTIKIEFGLSGSVDKKLTVETIPIRDMYKMHGTVDYIRVVCEVLFVLGVCIQACIMVHNCKTLGLLKFFGFAPNSLTNPGLGIFNDCNIWPFLDVMANGMFVVQIAYWMHLNSQMSKFALPHFGHDTHLEEGLMHKLTESELELIEIDEMWKKYAHLNTISMFITLFRIFKYFEFHDRLNVVYMILQSAAVDLTHYLLISILLIALFGFIGHNVLGAKVEDFSTPGAAVNTLMLMSLLEAEWSYTDHAGDDSYTFAWIYYWSFTFIVGLIMFNVLLAIVVDAYMEVKELSNDGEGLEESIFVDIGGTIQRQQNYLAKFCTHGLGAHKTHKKYDLANMVDKHKHPALQHSASQRAPAVPLDQIEVELGVVAPVATVDLGVRAHELNSQSSSSGAETRSSSAK